MNYLITGGTGFIGRHFIESLRGQEAFVTVLSRQAAPEVESCKFIKSLDEISDGEVFDVIINLAGKSIDQRWTPSVKRELESSRVETTRGVVDLVERLNTKPKMMLSASATGYYGPQGDRTLNEFSAVEDCFTHQLCDKWERAAEGVVDQGVRLCIVRLGIVLGAGGGFIKKVHQPFKLGLGGKIGKGRQYISWIHMEDVVSIFHYLINKEACAGAYNLVAPNAVTNAKMTQALGEVMKRPTIATVPATMIKLMFGEMGEALLLKGVRVAPMRLLEAGYEFQYSEIEATLRSALG